MTEEQVTKLILTWLEDNKWKIVAYDFPQSGTGVIFHPDNSLGKTAKTKGALIPDIIGVKKNICVFFENKDRFSRKDFVKVNDLIHNNRYILSINSFLKPFNIKAIYYGVGLPHSRYCMKKIQNCKTKVDFIILVKPEGKVYVYYDPSRIFS